MIKSKGQSTFSQGIDPPTTHDVADDRTADSPYDSPDAQSESGSCSHIQNIHTARHQAVSDTCRRMTIYQYVLADNRLITVENGCIDISEAVSKLSLNSTYPLTSCRDKVFSAYKKRWDVRIDATRCGQASVH